MSNFLTKKNCTSNIYVLSMNCVNFGWTDQAEIFCGHSRVAGGCYWLKKIKKMLSQFFLNIFFPRAKPCPSAKFKHFFQIGITLKLFDQKPKFNELQRSLNYLHWVKSRIANSNPHKSFTKKSCRGPEVLFPPPSIRMKQSLYLIEVLIFEYFLLLKIYCFV